MAKRPRKIAKDDKKTRKDGNEMAKRPGTILIRLQKAQERYPLKYSEFFMF